MIRPTITQTAAARKVLATEGVYPEADGKTCAMLASDILADIRRKPDHYEPVTLVLAAALVQMSEEAVGTERAQDRAHERAIERMIMG